MALQIVKDLCTACADCEPVCPTNSIKPFKGLFTIEAETCNECEDDGGDPKCLDVCMEPDCIIPV